MKPRPRSVSALSGRSTLERATATAVLFIAPFATPLTGAVPSPRVLEGESRRIDMIERVSPSVVCIFDQNLRGGGSGVLIDADGYGLTNYHVLGPLLGSRRGWGGLGDGVRYELEVLGIDVTGDVAMFRLIPPKLPYRFPHAPLGDSDLVELGDTAVAMGNPFMLSEDYTPSVSLGIVTGLHRYQQGTKGNLTYSDSIQVDAPINPGNSGGPLFNAAGEVIGINGRISVNTRGRFNVGFGYAITANQIKRFLPALRAGLLARHGHWQATVRDGEAGAVVMDQVQSSGAADRGGLLSGDRLLSLDGVPIQSVNQVISLMGTYPTGWPVPAAMERNGVTRDHVVRLAPLQPRMRRLFQADPDINRRQVEHVLRRFRGAVLGDPNATPPTQWKWRILRSFSPASDGTQQADEELSYVISSRSLTILKTRRTTAHQTVLEFDWAGLALHTTGSRNGLRGDDETTMLLATLHAVFTRLLGPSDEAVTPDVRHVGSDACIHHFDEAFSPGSKVAGAQTPHRVLEVIEWPVPGRARAHFGFDVETGRLARARVRNDVSGIEAVLDFGDYCNMDAMTLPHTVTVRGAGYDYTDTYLDWEIDR